jgi:hypothetical protein
VTGYIEIGILDFENRGSIKFEEVSRNGRSERSILVQSLHRRVAA